MTEVTALMAVYNGGRYVREAVASVLAQSGVDFEFIVIDDGSDDDTRAILGSFQDPRLTIVDNGRNLGLTASLNRGLAMARGEFVARMDADDACFPSRFSAQLRALRESGATVSFCRCVLDDETTGKREMSEEVEWPLVRWRGLFTNSYGVHSAALFHRESIRSLGGYDLSFRRAQDYELWDRCVAAGVGFTYVREPLLRFRLHGGAVTVQHGVEQEEAARRVSHRALEREFPTLSPAERDGLRWLFLGRPDNLPQAVITAGLARLGETARRFTSSAVWRDVAVRLARRLRTLDCSVRSRAGREMAVASLRSRSLPVMARSIRAFFASREATVRATRSPKAPAE